MKIVINRCYGGFGLSKAAMDEYKRRKGVYINKNIWGEEVLNEDIARDDPVLIDIVESMGKDAEGTFAELKVVEIPDDVEWQIKEHDGLEHIAEKHRTWS